MYLELCICVYKTHTSSLCPRCPGCRNLEIAEQKNVARSDLSLRKVFLDVQARKEMGCRDKCL